MKLSSISKKMKLLSLGAATLLAAGVFTGCGGSQQGGHIGCVWRASCFAHKYAHVYSLLWPV